MSKPIFASMIAGLIMAGGLLTASAQTPAAPAKAAPKAAPKASGASAGAAALTKMKIDVPYTKYVLANGLTLIVSTDTTAPVVNFNIWYHVGSKNEPRGQTGFAHLFEHLMYQGSENFNDDFFKATRQIGATEQNGSTANDRTNYYQTVPKEALDTILWLESDRMGHFLGALTQERLNQQRGVVQNEKRQGDNAPYAIAQDLIIKATYPEEHPYGHSVIGSLEDLDAASLEQVKDWFRKYYGPSNATIVLAGDVTPEEAKAKVERYFGAFAPGQPAAHPKAWVVRRTGAQREVAYDRVAAPRLYKIWNITEYGSRDGALLDIYADVLAGDRGARLTRRLVYDEQVATSVSASAGESEIAGRFTVVVNAKPGADMAHIEAVVDEEMRKLTTNGATASEMEKARSRNIAAMVRSIESNSGRASLLVTSQVYQGSPDAWKPRLEIQRNATAAQVQAVARNWLTDGSYTLQILPFGYVAQGRDADRSKMPLPASTAIGAFPQFERATLSNGVKVMLVERHNNPSVSVEMTLDTAYAADFASQKPGLGTLAVALMDEGTPTRDSLAIADEAARIGAQVSVTGGGEQSTVALNALTPTLDQALDLFADVALHPAFKPADIERVRAQQIQGLRSNRLNPSSIAPRVLQKLIFGPDHPLGRLSTEQSLAAITRDEIVGFHARWFAPQNATITVVGDTTLREIMPKLEKALGAWRAANPASRIQVASPAMPARAAIYLVDRPGSPQSYIVAGLPMAARNPNNDSEFELTAFNTGYGGNFTSRINMNLREEKGWSYGVSSGIVTGRGPRMFRITAQVQTDKTTESIIELGKELTDVLGSRPLTAQEVATSQNNIILGLSSRWQGSAAVAGALQEITTYGLPDTYYQTYPDKVKNITTAQALAAGRTMVPNQNFIWVVVGDRAKVEAGLRQLGPEVRIVDADGNPAQ